MQKLSFLVTVFDHLRRQLSSRAGLIRPHEPASASTEDRHFHAIVEAAPNAVLIMDGAGIIRLVNGRLEQMFGFQRTELLGKPLEILLPERYRARHATLRSGFTASPAFRGMGQGRELFGLRKDGEEIPLEIGLAPLFDEGQPFVLASIIDISIRKRAEQITRNAEAQALREAMLNSIPISVVATDLTSNIVAVNQACERLLGYGCDELVGAPLTRLHDRKELQRRWVAVAKGCTRPGAVESGVPQPASAQADTDEREWTYRRKDGSSLPVQVSTTTLRNSSGEAVGFIRVISDISARKQAEASISYISTHDVLTGMPNRSLLTDRLLVAMRQAVRKHTQVAVLLVDLDQFKQVNDSLGHHVGDQMLVAVASRLKACIRGIDTIGRLSGDEFLVVVPEVNDPNDLLPLIRRISDSVSLPLHLEQNELLVTSSIGGCLFPKDGQDVETLVKKAEAAMYQAKTVGRGSFAWFSEDLSASLEDKLFLESALHRALGREEISLHFQPVVSLVTGHISGMEALLRWQHPQRGNISPAQFIPIAEDSGLIVPLGEWALRAACESCVRIQSHVGRPLTVAVNVSPRQLRDKRWPEILQSAIADSGLLPNQLELEITEGVLMEVGTDGANVLRALREIGTRIVIDDFGTGYASLSYLTTFPIDRIKIDQMFIRAINVDARAAAVVNAVLAMAKRLNVSVTAEGIETIDQQLSLQRETCDEAQGFLYSRGLPMEELIRRFDELEAAIAQAVGDSFARASIRSR